jgi:hypothetical protein
MSKDEPISEEYFEYRLNHTMKVGEWSGLNEAAGLLMKKALEAFEQGDREAHRYRKLSKELKTLATTRHPGPPK